MTNRKIIISVIILMSAWLASCSKEKSTAPTPDDLTGDCRSCHTNQAKLLALAIPDTSGTTDPGEG